MYYMYKSWKNILIFQGLIHIIYIGPGKIYIFIYIQKIINFLTLLHPISMKFGGVVDIIKTYYQNFFQIFFAPNFTRTLHKTCRRVYNKYVYVIAESCKDGPLGQMWESFKILGTFWYFYLQYVFFKKIFHRSLYVFYTNNKKFFQR